MIKPCRKCGLEAEHYNSIPTCCKECWKVRVRQTRAANIDYYREYDRQRSKLPHRVALNKEVANRPHNVAKKTAWTRERRRGDKAYQAAHNAINKGIASGKIVKPLRCERCGAKRRLHGHHDDYTKSLEVQWLCSVCHTARHKEIGTYL
jgi:hypothetical protein